MTFDQIKKAYASRGSRNPYYEIARKLSFTEQTVRNWECSGIPHCSQVTIEAITGGKLKADKGMKHAKPAN